MLKKLKAGHARVFINSAISYCTVEKEKFIYCCCKNKIKSFLNKLEKLTSYQVKFDHCWKTKANLQFPLKGKAQHKASVICIAGCTCKASSIHSVNLPYL